MPEVKYFKKPTDESCFEYLKNCYSAISSDVGDYGAFVVGEHETSMPGFFAYAQKLSDYVLRSGFKPGDVISVFLPTCADAICAFYALNNAGIITEFIHPLTPPDGVAAMIKDTGSKGIFILEQAMPLFAQVTDGIFTVACSAADFSCDMSTLEPSTDGILRMKDIMLSDVPHSAPVSRKADETAVFMHGSGTTGVPKTVALSSFALNSVAYGQTFVDKYHEYGKAYSLCVLPCFHAFGLGAAVHNCMCNAYTCIPMPKFDAHKANEIISKYNVEYISGAPTMFRKMFEADNFINPGLKNLNVLYSGGDIVSESFIERFNSVLAQNGSKGKLFRGWGLTEMCAVCSTNNHWDYRADSIGKPLHGLTAAVFDENLNKLDPGEQGEIALSGPTMMNGYYNSDFSGIYTAPDSVKWVLTGDMGYIDEDGFIFFTGRKKRIIIISGYNVYPYAIEQGVTALDFVNEACAVQGYDSDSKSFVKLCVSLKPGSVSEDEARQMITDYCKNNFDKFSVPRKIVFLDALPRTKMDKLDFMAMSDSIK